MNSEQSQAARCMGLPVDRGPFLRPSPEMPPVSHARTTSGVRRACDAAYRRLAITILSFDVATVASELRKTLRALRELPRTRGLAPAA